MTTAGILYSLMPKIVPSICSLFSRKRPTDYALLRSLCEQTLSRTKKQLISIDIASAYYTETNHISPCHPRSLQFNTPTAVIKKHITAILKLIAVFYVFELWEISHRYVDSMETEPMIPALPSKHAIILLTNKSFRSLEDEIWFIIHW